MSTCRCRRSPTTSASTPSGRVPPTGPAVTVVGRTVHPNELGADELREAEAADVASAIARAVADGWSVGDGDGWRPARLGDVTVLVPARTSLPFLQDALDDANIPYRAESSLAGLRHARCATC